MTEAEWLGCDDPGKMLQFVQGKASERKLRLFAIACVRRPWWVLDDEQSRQAVEIAERYADGRARAEELASAHANIDLERGWEVQPASAVTTDPFGTIQATDAANSVGTAVPRASQCALLRDVFGNPFRRVAINPSWVAWDAAAVRHLAQAIYDERAFDRLPILGDALEDAGCTSEELLKHCRSAGEHVRGCWAVDLLLGKE
jgi:hypothetical protein